MKVVTFVIVIKFLCCVRAVYIKNCDDFDFKKSIIHPLIKQICDKKYVEVDYDTLRLINRNQHKEIFQYRKKRESVEDNFSPIAKIFVDSLVNTVKPSIGNQGFILDALKPFMVSVGTGFIKELMKFINNILDQGPFIDAKAFADQTYEAYPVFIPSYGAFVLLSKAGSLDSMKKQPVAVELEKSLCKENCTTLNNSTNETLKKNESAVANSPREDSSLSVKKNEEDLKNFFIGEAHLIPINSKTESFESSRQVEEAYKNEEGTGPVKQYIKQVMNTPMNIKSFKKRLILSMLKKMEKAIRDL